MYLVSPDYLNTVTSKVTPPPPPQSPNTEKAEKNIIAVSDYGL
jgi:hypothetical protein